MIWISLEADSLGLILNTSKCEIICQDDTVQGNLIMALPGAKIVSPERTCLLGSHLGCVAFIDASLEEKIEALKTMGARFNFFLAHDAFTLFRHSFAIPILQTAPCFLSGQLEEYNSTLRSITSEVTNTPLLQDNNKARAQATLPIRVGGLGVRSASVLAPSAYLSSSAAIADLVHTILHATPQSLPVPSRDWKSGLKVTVKSLFLVQVLLKRETGIASRWVWQLSPCWLRQQMMRKEL